MHRINLYIPEDYFDYLNSLSGTLSEHIRFAIDQYIHKLRQEETRLARNTSTSASVILKTEGGE